MRCVVDTPPKPLGMRIEELKEEHFMPVDVREKQLKPVCEACRGCTHELTLLVSTCWGFQWHCLQWQGQKCLGSVAVSGHPDCTDINQAVAW
jgi:hypothetical protein